MQNKLTETEGRSRRNNIGFYGVAQGESSKFCANNLLKTKHKLLVGVGQRIQPLLGNQMGMVPPGSTVVHSLESNTKELILKKSWKRKIIMEGTTTAVTGWRQCNRGGPQSQRVLRV